MASGEQIHVTRAGDGQWFVSDARVSLPDDGGNSYGAKSAETRQWDEPTFSPHGQFRCPNCKGSGNISNALRCLNCDGSGFVTR